MNQERMKNTRSVKPDNKGFTLLEILIVVVIISVLAAIAIPGYRDYILKSRRADAAVALTEIANLQEKFFSDNLTYTTVLCSLPYSAVSPDGYYSLNMPSANASGFTARAVPTGEGNQTDDTQCAVFTLNNLGQKASTPSGANECWR